jgi:hypothetical protein
MVISLKEILWRQAEDQRCAREAIEDPEPWVIGQGIKRRWMETGVVKNYALFRFNGREYCLDDMG